MPEKLKWSFSAQVAGSPTLAGSGDLANVDAYMKLNVTVPANGNPVRTEPCLQP
jgi:hypothetical protein